VIVCRLHITFIDKEGDEHTFDVAKGDNLLDIAQENDIEMEGGKQFVGKLDPG
jgi:ferredoxin